VAPYFAFFAPPIAATALLHAPSEQGKSIKDELSEQELDKASGGITFEYGGLQIKYTPQKPDGTA
jgi:hypothetical protein